MSQRNQLILDCHRLGFGHAEIAADFAISRERVRQIIKRELGVSTPKKLSSNYRRSLAVAIIQSLEDGKTIEEVAIEQESSVRLLGRVVQQQLQDNLRRMAFFAWMNGEIGKQFSFWQVLSISPCNSESFSSARCKVKAKCLKCGSVHDVVYRNIVSGASRMCRSCGAKNRDNGVAVIDLNKAEIFSSLKQASAATGKSYFQVRYDSSKPAKSHRFCRLQRH